MSPTSSTTSTPRVRVTDLQHDLDAARADAAGLRDRMDGLEHDRAAAVAIADEAVRAAEELRLELAVAQHDAQAGQQAAKELRQAEEARKARGRLRRAWDGWRGR